ncbi:MAG: hypothetical protein BGO98_28855 [Myxococcales bacterium 68-20]|nr:hypothetical protein [Myxococcales bacterium]OJY30780.1 MAG: hypothetical protein BGO98_28855 [Myxococcales bacterium 68-20]
MSSTTEQDRTSYRKLSRLRWIAWGTTIVPLVIGAVGVVSVALQAKKSQEDLRVQTDEAARLRDEKHALENEVVQLRATLREETERVSSLRANAEALAAQQSKLEVALSSPDTAGAIATVRATMADRSPRERAVALRRRAKEVGLHNRPELATQLLEAAVREDSSYAEGMIDLGFAAMSRKDLKEAEKQFFAAALAAENADTNGYYAFGLVNLINVLVIENRLDDAKQCANLIRPVADPQLDGGTFKCVPDPPRSGKLYEQTCPCAKFRKSVTDPPKDEGIPRTLDMLEIALSRQAKLPK